MKRCKRVGAGLTGRKAEAEALARPRSSLRPPFLGVRSGGIRGSGYIAGTAGFRLGQELRRRKRNLRQCRPFLLPLRRSFRAFSQMATVPPGPVRVGLRPSTMHGFQFIKGCRRGYKD